MYIEKNEIIRGYIDLISECCYWNNNIGNDNNDIDIDVLLSKMDKILVSTGNIEELTISLFVHRCVNRFAQWDTNLSSDKTSFFIIFNLLFWESVRLGLKQQKMDDRKVIFVTKESIAQLLLLGEKYYKAKQDKEVSVYSREKVNAYYDRIDVISGTEGDIHSYSICNTDIQKYLTHKESDQRAVKEKSLKSIKKEGFFTAKEFKSDTFWNRFVKDHNISNPADDMIIFSIFDYWSLPKRYQSFIELFEANNIVNSHVSAEVNEIYDNGQLAFAYKTGGYIYISKICLEMTQSAIESFSFWGQYTELFEFYFGKSVNTKIQATYNRLLTYKVADMLLLNGYLLPSKKVGLKKGVKVIIPQIEINKYGGDQNEVNSRDIGDIDIAFYSPTKNTFYVVEYKNYQMYVSSKHLSTEIAKVAEKETIIKVKARLEFINKDKNIILNNMYPDMNFTEEDIKNTSIKAVILSSKPNLYFFINELEGIE